jgi:serine/threonine-protein kinase
MRHQPGARLDRYEIIEQLGEGAYAETYKARDTASGETVVIKSINPTMFADPAIFRRFHREREIASRLQHPNVVGGRDTGDNMAEPYLVLEFVDGTNLRTRMAELAGARGGRGPLPGDVALRWGRQLASAIAYLHSRGIVHRDLKPENILVTADDELKIIDFGAALLEGAKRLTWRHLSGTMGTPNYMSPEQIQGERGDARSDIYAWGVMMYEFLTGHVPFGGDNWMAVMAGHLTKTPERIRKAEPAVAPALEAVVLRAMRRYPDNRYPSAADLLDDLDHLDTIDAGAFDLSPEEPLGGLAASGSGARLWLYRAAIAGGFVALVVVVVALSVVLR